MALSRALFFALVCVLPLAAHAQTNVIITEFLASNNSTTGLRDENNELNDWIEIHNADNVPINLQDWGLTDSIGNPFQWRFPATNINPGAYMIVWASEKNRRVAGAPLHTNFRLSTGGEYLALVRPDGTLASEFNEFPRQFPNISYGVGVLTTNNTVITSNAPVRVLIPTVSTPSTWTATNFNDSSWTSGINGVGFGPANAVEANYAAAIAPTAPVAYWRLNEPAGAGTATNIGSGANLNGTYSGATPGSAGPRSPQFGGFEVNNTAATFNPTLSAHINVPNSILNNRGAFTIAGWIRPTATPGSRIGLFGQNDCVEFGFISGTTLQCWTPGGGSVNANYTNNLNTWHHVAAVGDGSSIRIYVDGIQMASGGTSTANYGSSSEPFRIGGGGIFDTTGNFFNGQVDEVVVYHRALSVSELELLHQSGLMPTDASVTPFVNTDVGSMMSNINASAYIRIPFTIANPTNVSLLSLRMRYDDGFVAHINGTQLLRVNAPATVTYNSAATNVHSPLPIDEFRLGTDNLVPGVNVLAIQGLNRTISDPDFLIAAELHATSVSGESSNPIYFSRPSPGGPNSGGQAIPGPAVVANSHTPTVPTQTEDLLVTAEVVPTFQPVSSVVLRYRVMFTNEIELRMFDDGLHGDGAANDMVYGATIPNSAYTNGQMVRWFIRATDTQGAQSRWPLFNDPSASAEYLGTMVSDPNVTSKLPIVYLFAPPTILQPGPTTSQTGADSQTGGRVSLFYDGELYDNIHMELRGNSTAGYNKKSHRLNFNREHLFRHWGPGPRIRETSFVADYPDPTYMRQGLSFWLADEIGAPAPFYKPCRLQLNGRFYQLANHSDIHDVELLDRLGYDPRGALYNAAGTVEPSQFSTGGFEKKTRNWENNSDYLALANAVATAVNVGQKRTNLFEMLDLPNVINYMVVGRWAHENDDVWANMSLYHDNDGDNLWRIVPFDMNLSWGAIFYEGGAACMQFVEGVQSTNDQHKAHPFYGSAINLPCGSGNYNRMYDAVFTVPQTREMYLRRMRTMLDTYIGPPGTPYGASLAEQRILKLRDLIAEEANRDRAFWGWPGKGGQSNFDPGITFTNGVGQMITNFVHARRNHFYLKHSIANTSLPIGVTKDSNAGIPLDQSGNEVVLIHSFEVSPSSGNQEQEFICLTNPMPFAVDISGWELSGGARFTFRPGTVMTSNSVLYVSPNVVAFRQRTVSPRGGQGHFVVGGLQGQLSTRGETILLHDQWGRLVHTNGFPANPSAAQNQLRITEIMYSPALPSGTFFAKEDFEYIELKNIGTSTLDLTGVKLVNGITFNFTGSAVTSLAAGQTVLVVRNINAFNSLYGPGRNIAGQYVGLLDNAGERIQLLDSSNEEILDFEYEDDWYPITDGHGFSLVIVDENADPDAWDNKAGWRPSGQLNGTPGLPNGAPAVFGAVRVNEVLTHTDPPQVDTIELYNPTANAVDIGNWYLTDDFAAPKKYRIPAGTTIAPGGYVTFDETHFNSTPGSGTSFSLSSTGDEVFLLSADAAGNLTGYIHGHDFGPTETGVSLGIHYTSTGEEHFVRQQSVTLGAANSRPRIGPIIISEIMYRPSAIAGYDDSLDEFVELQNIGTTTALFDPQAPTNTWLFEKGIDFNFPTNVAMPGGSFLLLVNFNPTNTAMLNTFRNRYSVPAGVPILGPYGGSLNNAGELIELRMPDSPETNEVPYVLVERVEYSDSAPWPQAADGGGASLQRILNAPAMTYYNDPASWIAVAPTPGRAHSATGTAPQITSQPVSQTVVATTDATLSVAASGTAPLYYQWRRRGSIIEGATNALLMLDNVRASDRGEYDVLVYNNVGSTVSSQAVINILIPARILRHPASITTRFGSTNSATWGHTFSNFTFAVAASSSSPIRYQWRLNGVPIAHATNSIHVVSNATLEDVGEYDATITDDIGTIQSDAATLTIYVPVFIVQPPSPVTAVVGDTVHFIVNAAGTEPIGYRWRRNGINIYPTNSGVTPFSSYTIQNVQPSNAANYQVIVTNPGNQPPFAAGSASPQTPLIVLADRDGDRVPDVFEEANGFNADDPADGNADTDGDTMRNFEEFTAGTDPRDAQSYLRVEQIDEAAGIKDVTFLAQSNKTYTLQYRDDLTGSIWQRFTNVTARASNVVHTITDSGAAPNRFYRLVTPYQP